MALPFSFKTFQQHLLFWFLIFISSSGVIVALCLGYLRLREDTLETTEKIEHSYLTLLQTVRAQQNFFSYEPKNPKFFESQESAYLSEYRQYLDSTRHLLNETGNDNILKNSQLLQQVNAQMDTMDALFHTVLQLILKRGYKDYRLEGRMREYAHLIEASDIISSKDVLTLRRHEKDFIIRNDLAYVARFNAQALYMLKQLKSKSGRQQLARVLATYQRLFNELVELDAKIGIKDNTALKQKLDQVIFKLEADFKQLLVQVARIKEKAFKRLNIAFITVGIALILLSVYTSAVVARRITSPLRDLAMHITRFVDSNFALEDQHPVARTQDEIGQLTENFSKLKEEVIGQMKFFKQKVEERTKELAETNEANKRFVPKEFLNYLGHTSIREVQLGNHVKKEMTVLFTDIRSFTQLSERLSPRENFEFINQYLHRVVPLIQAHDGFIDKYIGDSIMALFPGSPNDAARFNVAFRDTLNTLNNERATLGQMPILTGTGVHTGELILGTIGHNDRLETTVISDAVNIAARLEGLTKFYEVCTIVSEEVVGRLQPGTPVRFLDVVRVKGKTRTLAVYELIHPGERDKIANLPIYEHATESLREQRFNEARESLMHLQDVLPDDAVVQKLLVRCLDFQQNGLPDGWDGVLSMNTK